MKVWVRCWYFYRKPMLSGLSNGLLPHCCYSSLKKLRQVGHFILGIVLRVLDPLHVSPKERSETATFNHLMSWYNEARLTANGNRKRVAGDYI